MRKRITKQLSEHVTHSGKTGNIKELNYTTKEGIVRYILFGTGFFSFFYFIIF